MPTDKMRVKDASNDTRYFALVPRIVTATCRNPFDLAVWIIVKEVAGEAGECWLDTESLAALAGMSLGQAHKSRAFLIGQGLLQGELKKHDGQGQKVWHLTVPNLWARNVSFAESHPKIADRIAYKQSLHTVKHSQGESIGEEKDSPSESLENPPSQSNQSSIHPVVAKNIHTKGSASNEGNQGGAAAIAAGTSAPSAESSGEGGKAPARKLTVYQEAVQSLTTHFAIVSHIPEPKKPPACKKWPSSITNKWFVPLGDIYERAGRDVDKAVALVDQAVAALNKDGLTIASPISIQKTVVHLLRGVNSNGKSNEQYGAYPESPASSNASDDDAPDWNSRRADPFA